MLDLEEINTGIKNILEPVINGVSMSTKDTLILSNPYDDTPFAQLMLADAALMERGIAQATGAFSQTRALSAWQRSNILKIIAEKIQQRRSELAEGITTESGKPVTAAFAEVDRAQFTFQVAAEEALRINGDIFSLDWLPDQSRREAHLHRVPRGLIAGITPFNFPLNLVAHKVAPALAAGNPVIIKPDLQTAMTAIRLGQIIIESGWPANAIAIVPCRNDVAQALVSDERIRMLSFTGSPRVGWELKRQAGKKPVTLELGGNAGNIIEPDADLEYALDRVVWGGYLNAGQTCISVQRVYIHDTIYEDAKNILIRKVKALKSGDPKHRSTVVGPVINQIAADRIERSIQQAVANGAQVLVGGGRHNLVIEPTLIESCDESLSIAKDEIFGPIVVLSSYRDFTEAITKVSDSDYGLQMGLFTHDLRKIQYAIDTVEIGGININDVSTFRIDHMPYGGVKASGTGREGIRYAIEEMTEMKLVTYNYIHPYITGA
ncbi:aldehyde dehydrogenase family protein [Legionella spiritensis]|uniref:Aldehyde dehydrogenase n=1 Tax=Legionella spiritensis TaxID=452 RepID=A0A0W0YWC3_LEGSP|nr:aldehyde dehydrogenase family protein [Legionella spiritensis]KTD60991.1 aldehyde dehydrogenase [Legionella spiritensis]SNV32180.1 aldehyde dehydrogenase [Legionella spiritensis]